VKKTTHPPLVHASLIAIILVAAAAFLLSALRDRGETRAPVVAVLPLDDLSAAPHRGYLSDAISEGIITELARFPHFRVVARNSSFQFRSSPTDVRVIGEALGAGYVVEGSQQYDGRRMRVTVQLIEADTGTHLFADKFERSIDDLFTVQNIIVRQIASVVGQSMMIDMPEAAPAGDVDARLRGLQARKLLSNLTRENWEKALALEEQSIREEPGSAWGYLGKSLTLGTGLDLGWVGPADEVLRDAQTLAMQALEIDPENYMAHQAMARTMARKRNYSEALEHFERAAALNPSDPVVLIGMSYPLMFTGQTERAIAVLEQAKEVDPMHGDWLRGQMGFVYWQAEECDKGLASVESMSGMPGSAYLVKAALLVCLDRTSDARTAMREFKARNPEHSSATEREKLPENWQPDGMAERWMRAMELAGLE
jgi:TolB-like protein